ncbi:hypothetical protein BBJ41_00195 [Burkholderia stabilis]|uniref:hypothetical protein n=1 Tax=Burkholderia stabilis TaxID=95485 RepID=UPI0008517C49|nr:hypothetical protein [Burkholderia stabilis]AOR66091.1 hypothetical protein BBJ41_00195 [Burkholderia stabilis]HDR9496159.1 hypothetical protein [Burkholderia stabilis]HDR9527648.1 hypothetical protein [Burkholderia stabilis]HDR9534530.1 hypothetical protein [Burkholderia stabilis]HDR9542731.1 hypothetical protein [Burkholderia stabilis]
MKPNPNNLHQRLMHIRDYNTQTGYAFAGLDAGREARGLLATLFGLTGAAIKLLSTSIGKLISR